MKLSKFNDFSLTKTEMKSIVGGTITCTCYYEGYGNINGDCSGPTVEACAGYQCSAGGINKGCQ